MRDMRRAVRVRAVHARVACVRAVRACVSRALVVRARIVRARAARAPLVKFVKRKIFLNLYCKMKVFNVYLFLARSS